MVVAVTGCLQPEDEIVFAQVENAVGRDLPWWRSYVSEPSGDEVTGND